MNFNVENENLGGPKITIRSCFSALAIEVNHFYKFLPDYWLLSKVTLPFIW